MTGDDFNISTCLTSDPVPYACKSYYCLKCFIIKYCLNQVMTCSKVSIMKGSQVNSSSQKSSQVSVLLSAASVTTSKDFLKSNAIKSDTMKFYWSLD